jgi:hypothetical protein
MNLFDADLAPFTIALLVMGMILLAEVASALFGAPLSQLFDGDVDTPDLGDAETGVLAWLYIGRAPLLILLAAFLTGFGITGLTLQFMVKGVVGGYLWGGLAAIPAVLVALPVTRIVGRIFARVLKREDSDAASREAFVGRIAIVVRGEARRGFPAEAKLRDHQGASHYILVEPEADDAVFPAGCEVLLVEQAGAVFRAIINPNRALSVG